ncbi:MAG: class I SAM-dependent methyltransferase, partial [Pseudomonadota bacterium]
PQALAQAVQKNGEIRVTSGGEKHRIPLAKAAAPLIARIDGRTPLAVLRHSSGLDEFAYRADWSPVERALTQRGLLHYSKLLAQ